MEMSFPSRVTQICYGDDIDTRKSVLMQHGQWQRAAPCVRLKPARNGDAGRWRRDLAARIHCFVADPDADIAVRGASLRNLRQQNVGTKIPFTNPVQEVNIKDDPLSAFGTGTDLNLRAWSKTTGD
jgi:hypothetical protein